MSKQTKFAPEDEVVGCIPLQLDENHAKEIIALVEGVPKFTDIDNCGINVSRFTLLIELYHFDPALLDSILVKLIDTLIGHIVFPDNPDTDFSQTSLLSLIILKRLTTVRGYKTVIRFLPHEVFVLPKLLSVLEYYAQKKILNDVENEAINMLLIWFIIVCRNPFDFHTFSVKGEKSYPDRIKDCLNTFRFSFGKYACLTLAETLTRHADNTELLKPAIDDCLTNLRDDQLDFNKQLSDLQLLSTIFKKGKRPELQKYGHYVYDELKISMLMSSENVSARLQTIKLLQRIALIYLKPKPAAWRYKCGVRSLEENLKDVTGNIIEIKGNEQGKYTMTPEPEDEDITELEPELEKFVNKILEILLNGISDNDNFVRASSAKGIGRIAARIPQECADCLVEKVFATNFTPMSSAGNWHGGCMAIAEFSQRGCILPKRLPVVMDLVCKALEFDDSARATAVNVRDASCYICWAFARGFGKDTLDYELLKLLAFKLVTTALFDRSVNVRRAASAAFQENVGRNILPKDTDKFPEGIILSTMIDYQSVARIESCYSSLCLEVATFGKYVNPMMDSILNIFSGHWDENIRNISARALEGLVKFDGSYAVNTLIPKFYQKLSSTDVDLKQGALLCIGSILKGLYESRVFKVEDIDLTNIKEIVPKFAKAYNSAYVHGSLIMLKAVGSFIESFAETKLPLNDDELAEWHRVVDRIIGDLNPKVREIGRKSVKNIMLYYADDSDRSRKFMNVVKEYFPKLEAKEYEHTRIGAALALGGIPAILLKQNISEGKMLAVEIIDKLIAVIEDEKFVHWVDARVAALNSIERIILKAGISNFDIPFIFSCFNKAIRDNTKTMHGLVGQFVRCATISAYVEFLPLLEDAGLLKQEILDYTISLILEQCCERIDKLREFAALQLRGLLERHVLLDIVEREKLYSIFVNKKDIKWRVDAFEPLAPLLESEFYHESILRGFINSIGGATGSWTQEKGLIKLEAFYRNHPEKTEQLFQIFLNYFNENEQTLKELIIPVTAFGRLFSEGCFSQVENEPEKFPNFVEVVKKVSKVAYGGPLSLRNAALSSIATVFQTNLNSSTFKIASTTLIALLTSKIPNVRFEAAKCFAQAVNVLDVTNDIPVEELDGIYKLLKNTQWRDNESDLQEAANTIKQEFMKVIENHKSQ